VHIFDVKSKEIKTFEHQKKVHSVCFSPDGKSIATASTPKSRTNHKKPLASIFDLDAGQRMMKIIKHGGDDFFSVCFSPDGKSIAVGSYDDFARVFDVGSGQEIMKTIKHGRDVTSICFSPDGKSVATSSADKFARIFHAASCKEIIQSFEHRGAVESVCFSPDGRRILTGSSDGFARIFNVESGEEIMKTILHRDRVMAVCFSPDGKSIATGTDTIFTETENGDRKDGFALVFDVENGLDIKKTLKHGGGVTSICFSPDSTIIATGSHDGFARVFDVATGKVIMKTIAHKDWVSFVCFSPDGKCIATQSQKEGISADGVFAFVFGINFSSQMNPCMVFDARHIALSSKNSIALVDANGCLRILPHPHNFSSDACLPVSCDMLFEWVRLPDDHQKQCFCSDSEVVRIEYFAPNGGGLVALASKWQDPDFTHALSLLKRLFDGEAPIFNAGLILRELLRTRSGSKELPHAATIEALLRNVGRNASFAARDCVLTQQLTCASCIPSIQSIVGEFWVKLVQLVPSSPAVVHNVQQVSFSESSRMYVAASDNISQPVFENYFRQHP
jgi:WD40 repeat protein